jgi:hypothetical protein
MGRESVPFFHTLHVPNCEGFNKSCGAGRVSQFGTPSVPISLFIGLRAAADDCESGEAAHLWVGFAVRSST